MSFFPSRVKEITFGEIVVHVRHVGIIPSPGVQEALRYGNLALN